MATQIKVNSATGNVTIQLSRTVIGTVVTANTANYANFAGTAETANNLNAATTANVVIGGGTNGYVLGTNGAGSLSWVEQTGGGGAGVPGGSNTQVQYNDAGAFGGDAQFTFNDVTDTLTVGTISATNIGNITSTNLDGNVANVLRGDGTFAADGVSSYGDSNVVTLLDAFGSNTITTTGLITGDGGGLSNIAGANISGAVANATHATVADSANAVAGANVTGEVSFAAVANSVTLANVSGAGNIASLNLDGNVSNVLAGDGTFIAAGGGATVPGGSNTQVQYNDNGAFAGEAGFEYNDVTNTLTVDNISANISGTVTGDVDGALLVDVYNNTGVTLNKGDAVYLTGGNNGDNPHVALADADDATKMPALGIIKENIATASVGQVVTSGVMNDSSHGYTLGADLYVSTTPGQLTTTQPTGESEGIQKIGKVVNSNQIIVQGAFRTNQTPNLDEGNIFIGNATNQATTANLYGEINTHLAAFGSNTITTTGNVDTGNLSATTSLFVDGVAGNLLIQPNVAFNGRKYSSISRGEFDAGNSTLNQAFITDSYNADGLVSFDTYANTSGGVLAEGGYFNIQNFRSIGNTTTDPVVPSAIRFSAAPTSANLASPQSATHTSMEIGGLGGGFTTVVGAEGSDGFGEGAWKQYQYRPRGIEFFRRAGNGEAREGVVANDETSIVFNMASNNGAGSTTWASNPAKIAAKVDSTFSGADNAVVPTGLEFSVNTDADATLTHNMYANGDVTFNATGVITGDGGGLSNIASANVSGLGNISTINLDGNAANYLGGTGVWGPIAGGTDANFANFAGNVTLSNQPNITQTGNLVTFTTNDGVANTATHQIDPTLITMPVNYSDTKAQEVITLFGDDNTPNYFGGQGTTTYLMNDINAGNPGFSPVITDYAASNGAGGYSQAVRIETGMDFVGVPPSGTNAYAPGRVQYTFAGPDSDLTSDATLGEVKFSQGGIAISPRTTTATQTGIIDVFHYGTNASDPTEANGLDFTRRRGNNASRVDIAAGDYLGNIRWAGKKATGIQDNKAVMGGRVSTTWNGTDNNIPTELFFRTQDNAGTAYDVEFKSDGQAEFPGNLTLNGSGIFTGDGGGLSNISATVSPGGFFDTIQFNNGGTLDGNSSFQFIPGSLPEVQLNGSAGSSPARLLLQDGILNIYTQDLSGGYAPFSFDTHNNAGGFMEPINYYRTRGTRAAPTAVIAGDQVKNERMQAYSGAGATLAYAGGQISTVQANDGLGNLAVTTQISTARPVSGPNSQDKIVLDTEFVEVAGNIAMPIATKATAKATFPRLAQTPFTVATLPTASVNIGERAMITDGPASWTGGALATTSGTNQAAPVYYDGSDWRFG